MIVKVLFIDVVKQEVTLQNWEESDMEQLYKWIGTSCLDHVTGPEVNIRGDRGCIFVDDVGLYSNKPSFWWPEFYHRPLVGNAIVFGGAADGRTIDVPYSIEELDGKILFEDTLNRMDKKEMPNA